MSVNEVAAATHRQANAVYWLLKQIYKKLDILASGGPGAAGAVGGGVARVRPLTGPWRHPPCFVSPFLISRSDRQRPA